jgi:hypothetical protein
MKSSWLAEVDAIFLFENEGVNWKYCVENCSFIHKNPKNCEFILDIPSDPKDFHNEVIKMSNFGCTLKFIDTYVEANKRNFSRILFWV